VPIVGNKGIEIGKVLRKVELAFKAMEYGEITIGVQNGESVFVDGY
jgi:hypothetical protein